MPRGRVAFAERYCRETGLCFLSSLPDSALRTPTGQRRATLTRKLREVAKHVDGGFIDEAIEKLTEDIRGKMDGSVDGSPGNDWIHGEDAQQEFCARTDRLLDYLEAQR